MARTDEPLCGRRAWISIRARARPPGAVFAAASARSLPPSIGSLARPKELDTGGVTAGGLAGAGGRIWVMPAEERKLATVLFADLVGSTELAGGQDPERVRAMLDRFYDGMTAEIERAGGTVEKFVGDAVMAAFGAPVAH